MKKDEILNSVLETLLVMLTVAAICIGYLITEHLNLTFGDGVAITILIWLVLFFVTPRYLGRCL